MLNLMNPAAVIFGGGLARLGERLLVPLREAVMRRTFVGAVASSADPGERTRATRRRHRCGHASCSMLRCTTPRCLPTITARAAPAARGQCPIFAAAAAVVCAALLG